MPVQPLYYACSTFVEAPENFLQVSTLRSSLLCSSLLLTRRPDPNEWDTDRFDRTSSTASSQVGAMEQALTKSL